MPFNPARVLLFAARRWYVPICALLLSGTAAFLAVKLFLPVTYRARAVLLKSEAVSSPQTMRLLQDMAKTSATLDEFRRRLGGRAAHLPDYKLAGLVDVEFDRRSGLVVITAESASPTEAASTANAYADAYLSVTRKFRSAQERTQAEHLTALMEELRRKAAETAAKMKKFKVEHGFIDFSKQMKNYVNLYNHYDFLASQARERLSEIRNKLEKMDSMIARLNEKIERESEETRARLRNRTALRKQLETLKERIYETRRMRELRLRLRTARRKAERLRDLHARGLVPAEELKTAEAELHALERAMREPPEVAALKKRIEELSERIVPKEGAAKGGSVLILKEMLLRRMELELDLDASREEAEWYEACAARVKRRMDALPALESAYKELARELARYDARIDELQENLDDTRADIHSQMPAFILLQRAIPPSYPYQTRRRIVAALVTCGGCLASVLLLLLYGIMKLKVESASDMPRMDGIMCIGECTPEKGEGAEKTAARLVDAAGGPEDLARSRLFLMVSSPDHHPLQSPFCTALAEAFRTLGFTCAILPLRPVQSDGAPPASWYAAAGKKDDGIRIILPPADITGTFFLSERLDRILLDAARHSKIIMADGPPTSQRLEFEALARKMDLLVLGIPAGAYHPLILALQAVTTIARAGIPSVAVVLHNGEGTRKERE